MSPLQIILGAILLLASIFLTVVVMLQDKAKRGLSGAIAGGSDNNSYLGKSGAADKGKLLSKVTVVVAIVFAVVVVVAYLFA